jgi:hypothetical protein
MMFLAAPGKFVALRYPYHRVGEIASHILQQLANRPLERQRRGHTIAGVVVRADAQEWWKHASALGEEAYFMRYVLDRDDSPRSQMLSVIADNYPQLLPDLYRRLLAEKPEMDSSEVAAAVAESKLPRVRKRESLLEAAKGKAPKHRAAALAFLKEFDQEQFHRILRDTFDELPKNPKEEQFEFSRLVAQTTDVATWGALVKLVQRAEPSARLTFLDTMRPDVFPKADTNSHLRFYAQFLNDKAAYQSVEWPAWLNCQKFERMEIRNYAAWYIAEILEIAADPLPSWTESQWAELRAKVKAALERAGIK